MERKTIKDRSKIKIKNQFDELNVFDSLINKNFKLQTHNDVSRSRLKSESNKTKEKEENKNMQIKQTYKADLSSTTVTIANVIHSQRIKKGIRFKNLRVLLDSGASESLIDEGYCDNKIEKRKRFKTANGIKTTNCEAVVHFCLPEFSETKVIHWNFTVASSDEIGYDMIIGRDIMNGLGIDLLFSERVVTWEGTKVPMKLDMI